MPSKLSSRGAKGIGFGTTPPKADSGTEMIAASTAGAWLGAGIVSRWPRRRTAMTPTMIDAAYPVVAVAAPGRVEVVKVPTEEAAKQVPWLVLVGEKDGGAKVWRQVEPAWRKAGVPVRVDYVAGKGHAWLFAGAELGVIDAWLSDVAAGKMPALPDIKPEETILKRPQAAEDPNAKPEPPEYR